MSTLSFKTLYALALAYFFLNVSGAAIEDLKKRGPGFLQIDFDIEYTNSSLIGVDTGVSAGVDTGVEKRGDVIPTTLYNGGSSYYADVYIGSNKQKNRVIIDTGSSDLWVRSSKLGTNTYGSYDSSSSSTYKHLSSGFQIGYGDGSSASGDWVKDTVGLSGGASVNLQFADVSQTDIDSGILGIGYTSLEASNTEYPNFPQALADAGLINKNAYSLYLNSPTAKTGSLLFGGIDNAKYSGSLVKLPSVGESARLNIQLQSTKFNGKTYNLGVPANVDSGTTLTYLPTSFAKGFADATFGAGKYYQDSQSGIYFADGACPSAGNLVYNFNGVSITVPSSDLLLSSGGQCISSVVPSQPRNGYLLGDTFLRHAYLVYDLDGRTISLAQVKYTTSSDISVIS